jgi:hypothetical protein
MRHLGQHQGMACQDNPVHLGSLTRRGRTDTGWDVRGARGTQNVRDDSSRVDRMTAEWDVRQPCGMWSEKGEVVEKDSVAVNYDMQDSGDAQGEESVTVSEAIILVGAVPCPMPDSVQGKGYYGGDVGGLASQNNTRCDEEPRKKRARILSSAGWKIIGSWYSRGPMVEALTRWVAQTPRQFTQGGNRESYMVGA